MEGNKQEAKRAAQLAQKFLQGGDKDKALRFVQKSLKMDPDSEFAKSVLKEINSAASNGNSNNRSSDDQGTGGNNLRRRKAPERTSSASRETPKDTRPFTEEQKKGVERIKRAKDLYEVLQVERSAEASVIKKSYRKLALKFHPDKNSAPGADEAFKEINRAFSVLSDTDKRRQYDQFGDASDDAGRRNFRRQYYNQDFDPNDIFREVFGSAMFPGGPGGPNVRVYSFGGGFGNGFVRTHRAGGRGGQVPPQNALMQLLPLIMLFLLSFMSFSFDDAANMPFSLSQTREFSVKMSTRPNIQGIPPDVPYFVKSNFKRTIGRDSSRVYQVEKGVVRQFRSKAEKNCLNEKRKQKSLISRYKRSGDDEKMKKAYEQTLQW
eukprot:CAMPEP_0184020752 /NCGR_PEP_ID=MMETSP0954-20121128/9530_1 /TAXON_ID=627963 /ORGANISM="Aplanochytrium sp, Strain PBS07" /LENGTH=377 /DNA_ID=CAMNT_0026302661 /DNA_START=307 /DNA_END=1437 /DNA_ORIENTATION=+